MGVIRNFFAGVGFLGKGFRAYATSPRLMWLGVLPALIVGIAFASAIVLLAVNLDAIVGLVTLFARGSELEPLVRIVAGLAIVAVSVIVLVYTYAATTLAVGDIFYERIWKAIESQLGDAPAEDRQGVWLALARGIGNGLRLLLLTVLASLLLFVLGLIPVVGQTLVPVLGAFVGGWFLTLELTGYAFDARGLRLRDRRRLLGARRSRTLGFGVATYLLFLVPFAALIVMPAAVAGATLLARDALAAPGLSTSSS
jgi:CysZ protein